MPETTSSQDPSTIKDSLWRKTNRPIRLVFGFILPFLLLILWDTILVWSLVVRYHMNDFGKFYYSTLAYLNNQDMYGPTPASFIQVGENFGRHFWNLNPPHFHIPLLPLGFLPPDLALSIWGIASFIAFIVGINWIGKELHLEPTEWQKRWLVLATLAFAGTQSFLITGQVSFFLFLPFTLAWIYARQGNWVKAAYPLGILAAMKPFLLVFVPYLILKRQFKAVWIMLALLIMSFSVGLAVFGIDAHRTWIQHLASVDWAWSHMNASILGMAVRTFTENPLYGAGLHSETFPSMLWIVLSFTLGSIALAMSVLDTQPLAVDHTFGLLTITALLISPLGWTYYFFLPLGPLTALVRTWWAQRTRRYWTSGEKEGLRNMFFIISVLGYLIPLEAILIFQPNYWATFTIGSAYFWCTLLLWICLTIDWRLNNPNIELLGGVKQISSILRFKTAQ